MFEELREYDNVIKIFASNPVKKDCKFSRIKVQYGEVTFYFLLQDTAKNKRFRATSVRTNCMIGLYKILSVNINKY